MDTTILTLQIMREKIKKEEEEKARKVVGKGNEEKGGGKEERTKEGVEEELDIIPPFLIVSLFAFLFMLLEPPLRLGISLAFASF